MADGRIQPAQACPGTGGGDDEIEFVRRILPNVQVFVAVEPDPASVRALRDNLRRQLPGVEASVTETALEDWGGEADDDDDEGRRRRLMDSALLFNVLFHVRPDDRRALFQRLAERRLSPDGVVVVVENESADASGFMALMKRLGNPEYRYR